MSGSSPSSRPGPTSRRASRNPGSDAPDRSGSNRRAWIAGLVAAVATIALRLPFVIRGPFYPDEGNYALSTINWLRYGRALYADQHLVRPPLLYFTYGPSLWLGRVLRRGPDIAVHGVATLFAAATVFVVVWFLFRRYRSLAAAVASVWFVGTAVSLGMMNASNSETFMLLPYAASGLLLVELISSEQPGSAHPTRREMLIAVASGALLFAAAMYKQVAATAILLPVAALLVDRPPAARWLRLGGAFLGGVALGALPFALWLAATRQAIAFVMSILSNFTYIDTQAASEQANMLRVGVPDLAFVFYVPAAIILCLAVVALVFTGRTRRKEILFGAAWLILSLVGVSASKRWYVHYFLQMTPALALIAGASLDALLTRSSSWAPARRVWKMLASAAVAVLCVVLIASSAFATVRDLRRMPAYAARRSAEYQIARFIRARSSSGDRVFLWGVHAEYLVYVDRRSATDVEWMAYPFNRGQVSLLGVTWPSQGSRVLQELRQDPPEVIALTQPLLTPEREPLGDDPRVPLGLDELIRNEYRSVGKIRRGKLYVSVYRLRSADTTPTGVDR